MKRPIVPPAELTAIDPKTTVQLPNQTCVYCGTQLTDDTSTKEHVVGRRFVPKGMLHQSWNLIVRSCRICNGRKSDLEDDLSGITMQPDSFGRYPTDDAVLIVDARRKAAKSISRRTKKSVKESGEALSLRASSGSGVSMSAAFIAPPQPDETRAFELARMHLSALFYWVTFDAPSNSGRFWLGEYMILNAALRADWGNVTQRAFAAAVVGWEPRVLIPGSAGGYFAAVIRKHPAATCWSWALEWNCNYRLTGFFGERTPAFALVDSFPQPETRLLYRDARKVVGLRRDVELAQQDDLLFTYSGP